jgi:hypothetical protein
VLGEGTTTAQYAVNALDPPSHPYTVRLVASDRPDLKVWLTTWYGQRLRVTSGTDRDPFCRRRGSQTVCVWPFPALEAQRPGRWVVHVRKRIPARVVVILSVTFKNIGRS